MARITRHPCQAEIVTITIEELEGDLHPVLARLRVTEPAAWLPVLSAWLVTRYDLADQVLRDTATFTVDDPRFSTALVVGPSMLSLDGAEHTRHRAPFHGALRPADRFAPFVTDETRRLVAALPPGHAELRRALAGPLAVAVVADGSRLGKINAHHTYFDLGDKTLRRISAARKDGHRVALVVEVRVAQRLLEGFRTNNLQRRAEDLVLIALH